MLARKRSPPLPSWPGLPRYVSNIHRTVGDCNSAAACVCAGYEQRGRQHERTGGKPSTSTICWHILQLRRLKHNIGGDATSWTYHQCNFPPAASGNYSCHCYARTDAVWLLQLVVVSHFNDFSDFGLYDFTRKSPKDAHRFNKGLVKSLQQILKSHFFL